MFIPRREPVILPRRLTGWNWKLQSTIQPVKSCSPSKEYLVAQVKNIFDSWSSEWGLLKFTAIVLLKATFVTMAGCWNIWNIEARRQNFEPLGSKLQWCGSDNFS